MRPVLDVDRVGRFLDDHCRPGLDLARLEIDYVKLRQPAPVLAVLRVPTADGTNASFTARWADQAKGSRWVATINDRHRSDEHLEPPGWLERPAVYSPGLELLFTAFPYDRRLPSLPLVANGDRLVGRLSWRLAQLRGDTAIRSVTSRPVRYKPESKCMFELTIRCRDGRSIIVYAKVAKRSIFERSRATLPELVAAEGDPGFALPDPLGVIDHVSVELFSRLPGVPLSRLIGTEGHDGLGAATGHALGQLHRLPVTLPRARTRCDKTDQVADTVSQLTRYLPSSANRAERLGTEIIGQLAAHEPADLCLTHHDFHGENVLVDGTALGLIDFEDMAMGDGAEDVGSMYAHLTDLARRHFDRTNRIEAERTAFVQAYTDGRSADRFVVHAAMHCLFVGYQALRYPRPDAPRRAEAMVAAAERLLEGAEP